MIKASTLRTAAIVLGFWTLIGLLTAGQLYVEMRNYTDKPLNWSNVLPSQLLQWYAWAALTPLVVALGRRFRVERGRLLSGFAVHVPASLAVAWLHIAWCTVVGRTLPIWPAEGPSSFWETFLGLQYTLHIELITYWAVVGVSYALEYQRMYRERDLRASELEARLATAQLEALRAQLQPHFLFNTLHGIAGLVRNNDNATAVEMIAGLSELLRLALENAGRQEVPLGEEIEFVERYLALQRMRFSDRLSIDFDVAPETLDALVPNLILQPLVENAIRHGVAKRASAGRIGVRACRDDGRLRLEVIDDGPGPAGAPGGGRAGGLGLRNTRERLAKLYGDAFEFDVREREAGGTAAVLLIPLRAGAEQPRIVHAQAEG